MRSYWGRVIAFLTMSIALSAPVASAQPAEGGPAVADGTYKTEVKLSRLHYGKVAFAKQGAMVTGYAEVWGPVYCFQGTLNGNLIQVEKSRARKEDEVGGELVHPYRLLPIQSHETSMLQSFEITSAITPVIRDDTRVGSEHRSYSNRPVTDPPIERLPSKETGWLRGCLTYYQEATEPPCDDPELRSTLPAADATPTYKPSITTVCVITDEPQEIGGVFVPGGVCTVENVFEVMSTTAVALAPLDDREQAVTDCGVLFLRSYMSPNPIRTQINKPAHQVTNSTLPGHNFHPGQVVREILEVGGRVDVLTVGTGNKGGIIKAANWWFAPGIWEDVDKELLSAFAKSMNSRTAEGFPKSELHDGTYRAGELSVYGATLTFRKRGDSVVGTYGKSTGIECYQGTITPTEIHVGTNVVRRNEDYATKVVTFLPIFEKDRDKFAPLRFYPDSIEPFPNPRALLGTTPDILARDTKWLNECSRHFGLPEKEPPPCGDSDLQDALLSCETRSQYFRNDVACQWTPSGACTAAKVFAVMLKTPNAIATVGTTGAKAQDCGVLSVRVPGGGEARVRTEFDIKHNIIKMYTLPGHPFHPSTIVRYVVDVGGRVDVNTEACGPDSVLAKVFAGTAAVYVWEGPNKALKAALSGNPTPKKPNPAPKKTGSATKKKP